MADLVINSITLDCTPGAQFNTDIEYRISGGGAFTSAGSALTNTDGTFVTPFVINGLAEDTCYDIQFSTTDFIDCPYIEMFCIGAGTTTTTTSTTTTTTETTTTTSTTTTTTEALPLVIIGNEAIVGGGNITNVSVNTQPVTGVTYPITPGNSDSGTISTGPDPSSNVEVTVTATTGNITVTGSDSNSQCQDFTIAGTYFFTGVVMDNITPVVVDVAEVGDNCA